MQKTGVPSLRAKRRKPDCRSERSMDCFVALLLAMTELAVEPSSLLTDKRTILIGRAEIDVDAANLITGEREDLRVAKAFAVPGDALIGDEGGTAVDADALERMLCDPVAAAPATIEIGRLVDLVVIGAGEAEIRGQPV